MQVPMTIRGQLTVCVMLLTLVFASLVAFAQQQDAAGRVTVVMGTVEAVAADGTVRELQRGDDVHEGETLRSDSRGRAQIRFSDRGLLSISPDTELTLNEYAFDEAQPEAGQQDVGLARGVLRKQTGQIAQANRDGYRVQTPVSVIGVRGTTYAAGIDPDSGATLVGALAGTIGVTSSTGETGVIGAGENYDYLRVNPDGTIDFLLEPPALLDRSPELDEGDAPVDEDTDIGGGDAASPVTGVGGIETTAGIDRELARLGIQISSDPERSGDYSPSRAGSGDQPVRRPIVEPEPEPEPALSPAERDLLLADDRVGVATGVPSLEVDDQGNVTLTDSGLGAGIATRNAPILALNRARQAPDTGRADVLASADLLLAGESSGAIADEVVDFAGVDGLVWGRFAAPLTLFLDADDGSQTLTLDNDILFALGTPSDLADLSGTHEYALAHYRAAQTEGGLPVSDMSGAGVLDLGSGAYEGRLGVDFGTEEGLSHQLASTFTSQVNRGVLEAFEVVAEFFDLATETSAEAEAELSGFFTGLEAEFLQMAFDFRVASRDDADVSGLALFEQLEDLAEPVLSEAERDALIEDGRIGLAAGMTLVEREDNVAVASGQRLASGLAATESEAALLAFDSDSRGLATDLIEAGRADTLAGTDVLLLESRAGDVEWRRDVGGIEGLDWARFTAPVALFTDPDDRDRTLSLERDLLVALGTPEDVAELVGFYQYDLAEHDLSTSGLPVVGISAGGLLNMNSAEFSGWLDISLGDDDMGEGAYALIAHYNAAVAAGLLDGVGFDRLDFIDQNDESTHDVEGELGGFFAGDFGRALQLGFDFRVPSREDADVRGLALLEQLETDMNLSQQEVARLEDGLAFVSAGCCFSDSSVVAEVLSGRTVEPQDVDMGDVLFGLNRANSYERFVRVGDGVPQQVDLPLPEGLGLWRLPRGKMPSRLYDRLGGDVLGDLDRERYFLTGAPADLASLEGSASFEFATLLESSVRARTEDYGPLSNFQMRFDVDFGSGEISAGDLTAFASVGGGFDGPIVDSMGFDAERPEVAGNLQVRFGGQVDVSSADARVVLDLQEGILRDIIEPGMDDAINLERSQIEGFFSGDDAEYFLNAFFLETEGEVLGGELGPIEIAGLSLVSQHQDLRLTPVETALFEQRDWMVAGSTCCGDNSPGAFLGFATEDSTDAVLGFFDGDLEGLPEQLLRNDGALAEAISEDAYGYGLFRGNVWLAGEDGEILNVDAATGDAQSFEPLALYQVAPTPDSDFIRSEGFMTFAGAMADDVQDGNSTQAGSLIEAGTLSDVGISEFWSSFNVDLASGQLSSGYLRGGNPGGEGAERSFEAFFEGFVRYADEGGNHLDVRITDGRFDDRISLDLDRSEIEGFFAQGDGALFGGSYSLFSDPAEEDLQALGIFALLPARDERLTEDLVGRFDRWGMATLGERFGNDGMPPSGILFGRSGELDPESLAVAGDFVSDSADHWGQPYAHVLLQEPGRDGVEVNLNAKPEGAPDLEGFEVGWGRWEYPNDSGAVAARLFSDPQRAEGDGVSSVDILFASVNPTPISQLPASGQFVFDGPVASLGDFQDLDVSFAVNFGSGAISDGSMSFTALSDTGWNASFGGQLDGAVTDFELTSIDAISSGDAFSGDLDASTLHGVLTGPDGERHVGAFHFVVDDFEQVDGLWVIDGRPDLGD